jgi:hypothetical protein
MDIIDKNWSMFKDTLFELEYWSDGRKKRIIRFRNIQYQDICDAKFLPNERCSQFIEWVLRKSGFIIVTPFNNSRSSSPQTLEKSFFQWSPPAFTAKANGKWGQTIGAKHWAQRQSERGAQKARNSNFTSELSHPGTMGVRQHWGFNDRLPQKEIFLRLEWLFRSPDDTNRLIVHYQIPKNSCFFNEINSV